jgi:hypothetical protein
MADPPLHPALEPLAGLLGRWAGEGRGVYPTVKDFGYREEASFTHVGKPFLAYSQRTWALDDGRPLHSEVGYWRVGDRKGDGWAVELVLAHPTGVVEIEEGTVTGAGSNVAIGLASTSVAATPTAKEVTALSRRLRVEAGTLQYELDMGAVGLPLQRHLAARLVRS